MKYFFTITIVLVTTVGYYWWHQTTTTTPSTDKPQVEYETKQEKTDNPDTASTHKTYKNDNWGISFEYPNNWEIREPAFGSAVSLFNLAIEPTDPFKMKAIVINILEKEWVKNVIDKIKKDGIVFTNDNVGNYDAIRFESAYEGRKQIDYLVLINNTYWIDISGKKDYETELNQVLNSLTITPVEITDNKQP